jgi:arylamine N-acetyltransferase
MPATFPHDLRDQVLHNLGFSAVPEATPASLAALYEAWCRNVPFDNIQKWIHVSGGNPAPLPGSTAEDFFQSWLKHRTGGTCWAGNGALCTLLQSIGFDAVRGVGTMLVSPDVPPNHGTVVVRFDDQQFLVDASILSLQPLLLSTASTSEGPFGVRLERIDEKWCVRWLPANHENGLTCRYDYFPTDAADFDTRHENTRVWSPFNYSLVSRILRGQCTVGSIGLDWYQLSSSGSTTRREVTRRERAEMLVSQLGYSEEIIAKLPIDQPVPPPPWSATAARAAAGT